MSQLFIRQLQITTVGLYCDCLIRCRKLWWRTPLHHYQTVSITFLGRRPCLGKIKVSEKLSIHACPNFLLYTATILHLQLSHRQEMVHFLGEKTCSNRIHSKQSDDHHSGMGHLLSTFLIMQIFRTYKYIGDSMILLMKFISHDRNMTTASRRKFRY